MMTRIVSVSLCFLVLTISASAEMNKPKTLEDERMNQAIEKFVQDMIQHYLVKTCGEVMQNAIQANKLSIFPDIAFQASQQAAVQMFSQQDMKDLLYGIFDENTNQAKDEINMGMPQNYIELGIKKRVEQDINLIVEDPVFRFVVEEMMKQAMVQQQKIMMMAAAQQQAQLMAIRQQQMMYQQMIMQKIMEAQMSHLGQAR